MAFAGLLLLALSLPLLAAELPSLTGRVVDRAGMIDADVEAALVQTLEAFEQKSSDQIVVATVASLEGEAIEPFANRLFRAWALGQDGEDNGVLLVVAEADRRARIEVGYGLEGTLTDLHSKLILENTLLPAFREGDFSGGIARAVDDIVLVLSGNAAELEARAERNREDESIDLFGLLFVALFVAIFVSSFGFAILARIYGRRLGPGRYRWLGVTITYGSAAGAGGWSSGSGGWSSGGGGFSGGGGSSGGGGASGSW